MRHRAHQAIVLAICWTWISAGRAQGAALDDVLEITKGSIQFDVHFDDDVATTDPDYFPLNQAERARDALSAVYDALTGTTLSFQTPWVNSLPDFNINIYDSDNLGGASSGGISIDAPSYKNATECSIRLVVLHEFFHTVEYSYNHSRPGVQRWAREACSRIMEDRTFADLDSSAVCTLFYGEVNDYLANPNQYLFGLDNPYKGALFMAYATEQLGNTAGEPQKGADFVRRFWERVMATANNDTDDAIEEMRQTVSEFAAGKNVAKNFDDFFRDFGIANYTHDLDATDLPNPNRYRYIDETAAGGGVTFDAVDRNTGTIPSSGAGSVDRYGNTYYEATVGSVASCNVIGFHGEADETVGWALIGVKSGDRAVTLQKGKGTSFYAAVFMPATDPFVKLAAVVTGLGTASDFTYDFAAGGVRASLTRPTTTRQALVGPHDAPGSFIARLRITGVEELTPEGSPSVKGLSPDEFDVTVGDDPAPVITGAYIGGDYWLVVQAPEKDADGAYDLEILICGQLASSKVSVLYGDYRMNQVLVIDRSGSMTDPVGNPKIDAAKAAAALFVDAARTGDRLGAVTFNGNQTECNDDSQLIHDLADVTDGARWVAKKAIGSVSATGFTSIGDGIERAEGQLDEVAATELDLRYIILLSDGMENEGRFWESTNPCAAGGSQEAVRPGVLTSGTVIHAIALGPQTNQELMQQIAADTNGDYYYVDVSEAGGGEARAPGGGGVEPSPFILKLPNWLAEVYAKALERILDQERLFFSVETVVPAKPASVSIPLAESEVDDATFFANWDLAGAGVEATLFDPSGAEVTEATHPVEIFEDATHKVYRFRKSIAPTVKPWALDLMAAKAEAQVLVGLSGKPKNRVRLELSISQVPGKGPAVPRLRFLAGMPVGLAAILTDAKGVVLGARVEGEIQRPDGAIDEIELLDDGAHEDGEEGDGIYGVLYTRTRLSSRGGVPDDQSGKDPGTRGSYIVAIAARGESNLGGKFTRYASGAFQIYSDADLNPDGDKDGMPDRWEIARGLDPARNDAAEDPDGDGLTNIEEYRNGTDPLDPDTDDGGENDGSEVKGRRNPLDPADDQVCKVTSFSIVTRVSDGDRDGIGPVARANVLAWSIPFDLCKPTVHLFRAIGQPSGFKELLAIPPEPYYIDKGLQVGVPHYYYLVLEGPGGELSPPSDVVMGIPLADPKPPEGWIRINCGASRTDSLQVLVTLDLSSKAAEFTLSTSPAFPDAKWLPLEAARVPFTLAQKGPVPGLRFVYCKYRNASGAESYTYSAGILFDPTGDFDGDRIADAQDPDDDGDGVSDADEIGKYCTDPYKEDTDGDGIEDGKEIKDGTNPWSSDTDGDGLKDPVDPDPTHPAANLQRPGDANQDGVMDLSDAVATLGFLFLGNPARLPCGNGSASDPANVKLLDVNGDGPIDLSDPVSILSFLFLGGRPPVLGTACVPIAGCPPKCR